MTSNQQRGAVGDSMTRASALDGGGSKGELGNNQPQG